MWGAKNIITTTKIVITKFDIKKGVLYIIIITKKKHVNIGGTKKVKYYYYFY